MSEQQNLAPAQPPETKSRPVGGTESSWCRAVPGGTGITVLAMEITKPPDISLFQAAVHKLQNAHPILKSKLHCSSMTKAYSYITPHLPHLQFQSFDLSATSQIIDTLIDSNDDESVSSLHHILEHELNRNSWVDFNLDTDADIEVDLMFASVYDLGEEKWVVAFRLHTSACDRTTAVSLLRELVVMICEEERRQDEFKKQPEENLVIEDYVPKDKGSKSIWTRGIDVLGYSVNSFRLANLNFEKTDSPRSSRVIRMRIDAENTGKIISGCESRGIKLCGLMSAAGLIAARSAKNLPEGHWEKYAVVTLVDCRSILDPVLSSNHHGFYHSAILNTHDIKGGEDLWEMAKRTYSSFANAKRNNKHFTDMGDVNFLMCKAIENPGLTPSSSLRTSAISVFEEPVVDQPDKLHQEYFGLKDYIGCASVHGIGPSIAVFDTIRDGQLDCVFVYPSPLHSRKQMRDLINDMKRILVAGCSTG